MTWTASFKNLSGTNRRPSLEEHDEAAVERKKNPIQNPWKVKRKSNPNGNIRDALSEIPCHLISDLHEWRNDLPAVSNLNSVKLNCP